MHRFACIRALMALLVLAAALPALAQVPEVQTGSQPAAAPAAPEATVRYMNRRIVTLRASALGYSPAERADAIKARIDGILQKGGPGTVTLTDLGQSVRIDIDGQGAFYLYEGDIRTQAGETLAAAAQGAQEQLRLALGEARELRDSHRLVWGTVRAAIAAAVFIVATMLVFGLRNRIATRMASLASQQAEKVRVAGIAALQATHVADIVRRIATGVAWTLVLLVGYLCLTFALEQFPYTRAWGERLGSELLALFVHIGQAILGAIPGLFVVVVIFLLARFVVNAVAAFLHRFEAGHLTMGWLDADTAGPTRRIASVIVWLFALAMAYPYLPGSQSDAFKGLSVLVGLMVSIGASGVIGQALSGLSLMYSKALRQGEYVKIGETEGTVTSVGMFATKIRTGMGEEVSLPNAVIVGNPVRNFSRVVPGSGFVLHTTVTIGYSTPWRQVHAMLIEAANRTPGILKDPTPFVVQTALSDWYVEYRLCALAGPEAPKRRAEAMNALHANIQDVFNEYGVQIMSPHYVMDTAEPQVVPKENWAPPPAAKDPGKAGAPRSE